MSIDQKDSHNRRLLINKDIVLKISRLCKNIRDKHRSLTSGIVDSQKLLKTVEPLKQIIGRVRKTMNWQ